jgi:hypothetical protein
MAKTVSGAWGERDIYDANGNYIRTVPVQFASIKANGARKGGEFFEGTIKDRSHLNPFKRKKR